MVSVPTGMKTSYWLAGWLWLASLAYGAGVSSTSATSAMAAPTSSTPTTFTPTATVAPQVFTSDPRAVSLVELYTSEGCSSCPPAERWLGEFMDDDRLWRSWVPVAFHVQYWDYLGWRDVWAQPEFARRQRAYAAAWGERTIYTPAVVVQGRPSSANRLPPDSGRTRVGELEVARLATGEGSVTFRPAGRTNVEGEGYTAWVAELGGGFTSQVRAGENAGRTLGQEFVVLALQEVRLTAVAAVPGSAAGGLAASETGPELAGLVYRGAFEAAPAGLPASPRRALAAWVAVRGELTPLQATGGWIESAGR